MQIEQEQFDSLQTTEIVCVDETTFDDGHVSSHVKIHRVTEANINFATELLFQGQKFIWGSDSFDTAQLAAGVFQSGNHGSHANVSDYEFPDRTVPISFASAGQQVMAGYMKLFYDEDDFIQNNGGTRKQISLSLDIKEDTVSSHCYRVKWDGCTDCGSEQIEEKTLRVGTANVEIAECFDCGACHVIPEDREQRTHEKAPLEYYPSDPCVDELEPTIGKHENDEYSLWCCPHCGFFTTDRQRHC